jgi:HK97 gp10 family phage protein
MTVRGVPEALAALERRKIAAEIAEPIAAKAGGEVVAANMKAHAPRDTGTMANSIIVQVVRTRSHAGPTVPYARFVNFGTRYISAQPFVSEAADESEGPIEAAMAAIFKIAMR